MMKRISVLSVFSIITIFSSLFVSAALAHAQILNGSQLASPSTLSQVLGYTGAGLTAGSTIAKIAGLF